MLYIVIELVFSMVEKVKSSQLNDSWTAGLYDSKDKPSLSETKKQKDELEERGGPKGLEPTRYGDWEKSGRCIDF